MVSVASAGRPSAPPGSRSSTTRSHFTVEESFVAGPRLVQRWRFDWGDGHVRGIDVITVRNGQITEKLAYVKG
jgi:hypothetical protein